MIEDGLFRDHPVDEVFALHNWPSLEEGAIACRPGPQMAGFDTFDITISGIGGHAALPHQGTDGVLATGQLLLALQSVISRDLDPQAAGVISVTQVHGGYNHNVIPEEVRLAGCTRYLEEDVQAHIRSRIHEICEGIGKVHSVRVEPVYRSVYPPTINHASSQQHVLNAALTIASNDKVYSDFPASMASEDFSFMLGEVPGAYLWLGNGSVSSHGALHSPETDFNDAVLPVGAQLLAELVVGSNG